MACVLLPLAAVLSIGAWLIGTGAINYARLNFFKTDRFQHIPRPRTPFSRATLLAGDMPQLDKAHPSIVVRQWMDEAQSAVLCVRTVRYTPNIWISDPVAMNYILSGYDFGKPRRALGALMRFMGPGLLSVEGEVHRNQRRILAPAFSTNAIKALVPVFWKHANKLTARLGDMIDGTEGPQSTPQWPSQTPASAEASQKKKPVLDLLFWTSRVTLDVIGDAGFGEDLGSVDRATGGTPHAIADGFRKLLIQMGRATVLRVWIFFLADKLHLTWLVTRYSKQTQAARASREQVNAVGKQIVDRKRKEIEEELQVHGIHSGADALRKSDYDQQTNRNDLLHVLMRANLSSDVKASERLDDDAVMAQIMTFIFAGHETTATSLAWGLHFLAVNPQMQTQLRVEVIDRLEGQEELDYDALNSLDYLNAVVMETLRLVPPVFATVRVATRDMVVPLSKAYRTADGSGTFDRIVLKKGDDITMPISVTNTWKELWGDDADEFQPKRWSDIPQAVKNANLPLGGLMTFLSGPRACIGNRFTIVEMKAILACLIAHFRFEPVPGWHVAKKQAFVTKPIIIGQEKYGLQQPLLISRVDSRI